MQRFIIYLFLLMVTTQCSDINSSFRSANKRSSDTPEEGVLTDGSKACYPGLDKSTPKCWNTYGIEHFDQIQAGLYKYSNPFTDASFPGGFSKNQYLPPAKLLHLESINIREWLTPSFMRIELMPSNLRRGLYGLFSRLALAHIQMMRDELNRPLVVTSGFRSPGHNSSLPGAAKWSRHTYGDAIDFAVEGISFADLARLCMAHGASFYQIYKSHIHCDWRGQILDPAFYGDSTTVPGPTAHSHRSVAEQVSLTGQIIGSTSIQSEQIPGLRLSTSIFQEDGGQLTHVWEVFHPDGEVTISHEPSLALDLPPGAYKVKVTLGGSVELTGEYQVNP